MGIVKEKQGQSVSSFGAVLVNAFIDSEPWMQSEDHSLGIKLVAKPSKIKLKDIGPDYRRVRSWSET
ncbi:uncharacterized protein N7483_003247 [Penicillium malachiteum]|uniref:uncharacterized protein n=1 Tax=Penicillium malachiteum TaxID=1324776 RepID=UPI002547A670|nr:uncharacterized protein N7483_003247 [Penicillium malachiteum]KAJ5728739.1 hypothetical protein N7483_003247 [Penicillium malachiteum]